MGIGPKIKEYRNKLGITQKDMAEELHVTYQAVSRWENDDAEPSYNTLKEMCKLFHCTVNDLFEVEMSEPEETIEQQSKNPIAICEQCGKALYTPNEFKKITLTSKVRKGRRYLTDSRTATYCSECDDIRVEHEKKMAEISRKETESRFRKRRIHSFIWPTLIAIFFLVISISSFVKGDVDTGGVVLVFALLVWTFTAVMILKNTVIPELWLEITSWGFVKLPGIIFELSLDGFIFLIVVKILFWFLGIVLAILAASFATLFAMALSVFFYPFALIKNLKCKE